MAEPAGYADLSPDTRAVISASIAAMVKAKDLHARDGQWFGQFRCPHESCCSWVSYVVSKRNGHTSGHCEAEGCVSWME